MYNITVKDIVEATSGKLLSGDENVLLKDICINSREIKSDDLFVPIVGQNVDSHKFIQNALSVGSATLTTYEAEEKNANGDVYISEYLPHKAYIKVKDTEKALQQIGGYIRSRYTKKVIGVTGSVGKTTTREMITAALSENLNVFHTEGNLNSQIGVPITLSKMTNESDVAVLELGISEEGHMDSLTTIVKPDIAVVTMIGVAHIEFMKTQENIRTEKLKIASKMDENGVLFLNGDDKLLAEKRGNTEVTTFYYGTNDWCDYRAENIRIENGLNTYEYCHGEKKITVSLSAMGKHNVLNSLVGMAISDYLGLDLNKAAGAYCKFSGLRQKVFESSFGYTVIDDTYNASPDSMKASIGVLDDIDNSGKKIAVLGDMFELGDNSLKYHYEVGEAVAKSKIDILVVVGEMSKKIAEAACKKEGLKIVEFGNNNDASEYIRKHIEKNDVILLKGSNGMHLSEIVEKIK